MGVFYAVVAIILLGIMATGIFVLGAMFMRHMYREAQEDARHDMLRYEFYQLAGVQRPTDPKPYVPPRQVGRPYVSPRPNTPRSRMMAPGMSAIERRLKEGKRATIMWRAGDRNK